MGNFITLYGREADIKNLGARGRQPRPLFQVARAEQEGVVLGESVCNGGGWQNLRGQNAFGGLMMLIFPTARLIAQKKVTVRPRSLKFREDPLSNPADQTFELGTRALFSDQLDKIRHASNMCNFAYNAGPRAAFGPFGRWRRFAGPKNNGRISDGNFHVARPPKAVQSRGINPQLRPKNFTAASTTTTNRQFSNQKRCRATRAWFGGE